MNLVIDSALDPLDKLRRALLLAFVRVPVMRRILVRREIRVPALLTLHASAAFVIAVLAPAWSLVLAPLVLGVPHIAADVRYLVLRRGLPRWWVAAIAAFGVCLLCVRVLQEARPRPYVILVEHALGSGWVLVGALGGAVAGLRLRSVLVIAGAIGIGIVSHTSPQSFRFGLVHAHNLVAIAIWLVLFRRSMRCAWLPVTLVLAAATALACGMLLPITLEHGVLQLFGLHLFEAADWLAPGFSGTRGVSLTVAFAFLQSVHYAVWLVAIPQDDARAEGSPNVHMKYRALRRDFGSGGLGLVALAMFTVAAAGVCSALTTRNVYLSLATFHTWLELALFAFLWARGGADFARAR